MSAASRVGARNDPAPVDAGSPSCSAWASLPAMPAGAVERQLRDRAPDRARRPRGRIASRSTPRFWPAPDRFATAVTPAEDPPIGGLEDLRLFDADGDELPYLLMLPESARQRTVRGTLLPLPATKGASGFELDLGRIENVDRLALSGLPSPLLKRYRLEGSGDRERWVRLVDEGTLFDLPAEGLSLLTADFPAGPFRYLRWTWNDATSGRVRLPETVEARLLGRSEPPPATSVQLDVERRASEPRVSRFHLRLPGRGLPVAAIQLAVAPGDLYAALPGERAATRGERHRAGGARGSDAAPVVLRRRCRGGTHGAHRAAAGGRSRSCGRGRRQRCTGAAGCRGAIAPTALDLLRQSGRAADRRVLRHAFGDRAALRPRSVASRCRLRPRRLRDLGRGPRRSRSGAGRCGPRRAAARCGARGRRFPLRTRARDDRRGASATAARRRSAGAFARPRRLADRDARGSTGTVPSRTAGRAAGAASRHRGRDARGRPATDGRSATNRLALRDRAAVLGATGRAAGDRDLVASFRPADRAAAKRSGRGRRSRTLADCREPRLAPCRSGERGAGARSGPAGARDRSPAARGRGGRQQPAAAHRSAAPSALLALALLRHRRESAAALRRCEPGSAAL